MSRIGPSVVPIRSMQVTSPPKEAWDLDRFVAAYNAVAVREKGWAFQKTPDRIKYAQSEYESGKHTSLAEFAERRYVLDQESGDV